MPKPRRGMNRRTFLKTTGGIALAAATISPSQSLNQAHAALTIDDKMAGPLRSAHPYEIHPMLTTRVDSFPMAMFTYLHNFDKFISIGVGFFYIKGVSGQHIIVDTGSPDITFNGSSNIILQFHMV